MLSTIRGRIVFTGLAAGLALAVSGSLGGARTAVAAPAPPDGARAADPPPAAKTRPRRDRALERRLRAAIISASTTKDATRRATREAEIAAADRDARYYALAELADYGQRPVRRYAWRGLLALKARGGVIVLCRQLVQEADRGLRVELTRTIQAFGAQGVGTLFVPALREKLAPRRFRALLAMGVFRDRRLVAPLVTHLTLLVSGFGRASATFVTQRAYIRNWRLVSGGTGNQVVTVPDPEVDILTTGVTLEVKVRRVEIQLTTELLTDLTGAGFGPDPAAWRRWLAAHPDAPLAPPR